ncbi:MAG: PhzF family phenazine biosynthesis protein [Deltaproteobacteria bacterium]|nr:PhzF family phenazine biosynthesis protein [Deltaproteobacteria bacterium]
MKKPVYILDAFTSEALRGNSAAVVLDGADLDDATMQRIAGELKHAETVFPLPARDPSAAWHLRWFTPTDEVLFCGHATLAALRVMVDEAQRLRVPVGQVVRTAFTCKSGMLRVELTRTPDKKLHVAFEAPPAEFKEAVVSAELLMALGLIPEVLEPSQGPRRSLSGASQSGGNLYICLRDRETLARAAIDQKALAEAMKADGAGGVILYALQPKEGVDAAARAFFPMDGVPEDAVTGSALAQLGLLLQDTRPDAMPRAFRFTQGTELHREGHVLVSVRPEPEPGQIRAWLSGDGVVVMRGELDLRALVKAKK